MLASWRVRCFAPASRLLPSLRRISGDEYHQVDWDTPALKYLRYVGVDIPNLIRLYKRLGKTKYFTRDRVADLVEFFDHIGMRGSVIKDAIICAPDLLRVPMERLEARVCWYRDVFRFSHQEFRTVMEIYPNLLEDKATLRFEQALQYFKELGLTREQYRAMLLRCPTVLHNSIQDSVAKTVDYFLEKGVSREDLIESIVQYPELLNLSLMGHIMPKAHYFETELGITKERFAQVFVRHGWVLRLNLESDIRHTMQWLLDFGASKTALGELILKFPPMLGYSVESNLKPKLDYFIHYLGMPFGEVALMIEKHPGFVSASLKEHIRPLVWCLEHELSMPPESIQHVFIKAPRIFTLSFGGVIKPTIDYFIQELDCRKDHFARMLTLFPQLLCYGLEDTIKPKIEWLRETTGLQDDQIKTVALHRIYPYTIEMLNNKLSFVRSQLDIQHSEMQKMICTDASFLHKSLSNLAKKIQFVETELKKERREIAAFPQFLGYSLSSRLQPRCEFLQSLERDFSSLSLQEMFVCSDDDFAVSVAKSSTLKYSAFKTAFQERQAEDDSEDEKANEQMLEETFFQEQSVVPIEEIREAERRFARNFKYQME